MLANGLGADILLDKEGQSGSLVCSEYTNYKCYIEIKKREKKKRELKSDWL